MDTKHYNMRGLIRLLLDYPLDMEFDEDSAREIISILETVYIQNDKVTYAAILGTSPDSALSSYSEEEFWDKNRI